MRHPSPDLTMNVCTDPSLLDVAGALDVMPDLSLEATVESPQTMQGHAAEGLVRRPDKAWHRRPAASS
jgi:hypothetical protein